MNHRIPLRNQLTEYDWRRFHQVLVSRERQRYIDKGWITPKEQSKGRMLDNA